MVLSASNISSVNRWAFYIDSLGKQRWGLQLWKSSILPALYHGLETESLHDSYDLGTVSTMEGTAQETDVTLQNAGETGRLMLR